uniref:Rieske domain-containing protein n=1 Tax=Parastrongyloides trichosuri TaxID=131310 RepID=A0A0N5A6L5_PARTI
MYREIKRQWKKIELNELKMLSQEVESEKDILDFGRNNVEGNDLISINKNDSTDDKDFNSTARNSIENDHEVHDIFIINENEINDGRMREISLKEKVNVLVVKQKGSYYILAANCANCNSSLKNGILSKNRIRCFLYGTCYDVRTGYIEDYPGIYSQNIFAHFIKDGKLYVRASYEMLAINRKDKPMVKSINITFESPIIIVGSGISALTCAEVLRQNGFKDPILMLTKDTILPYYKFLLPMNPNVEDDNILIRNDDFFKTYHIDIRLNTKVLKVDVNEKIVYCNDNRSFNYTNLIVATGTVLKPIVIPGSNLQNVIYFKNNWDSKTIYEKSLKKHVTISNCTPDIITLASSLRKEAKSVTIYNKHEMLLKECGYKFNEELIKYLMNVCKVNVKVNESIRIIEGEEKVGHLVLSNGFCAVSHLVIPFNGETACSSFLLGSKVATSKDNYILVDDTMRTNIPNVYAIGDCAILKNMTGSNATIRNSWQLSQLEGKICAMNILNKNINIKDEAQLVWFYVGDKIVIHVSKFYDKEDEIITRGSFHSNDFISYYILNDYVVGVLCFGNTTPAIQLKECFKQHINITKGEVEVMTSNNWSYKLI